MTSAKGCYLPLPAITTMTDSPARAVENLNAVREKIAAAAERSGRKPRDITLVAVTKEASPEQIKAVLKAGQLQVGENRAQDMLGKIELFQRYGAEIHFIGRLQTNKVKKILPYVRLIHSVDRSSLVEEISARAVRLGLTVDVLVQVNTAGEGTKTGLKPAEALDFCRFVASQPGIRLRGLMMIAPYQPAEKVRKYFVQTRELFEKILNELRLPDFDTLSMGMSNDYEVAIEEGSTMVRIGSAIFGGA